MKRLIAIAMRNLLRNKRRTLLTGISVLVGVTFVVFLNGFFNGFVTTIIRGTVETQIAAIQVHRQGFLDAASDPLKKDMPDNLGEKIKTVPGVLAVAPRLSFEGFANNGTQASVFTAVGIDPRSEYLVCPRRDHSTGGKRFAGVDEAKVFFGEQLARSLDLKPGASVSLLSATQRGNQNALDAEVAGTLTLNIPFAGKRAAVTTLGYAQQLLRMPGRVTEYAVAVNDLDRAAEVAAAVRAALGPDYDVVTWQQRDPDASAFVGRLRVILAIISVVFFVLILSGIVNTMLMSVYERVREIGTMLAVGVRRSQVMVMFLAEATALGLVTSAVGAALGGAVVFYLSRKGVMLTPPGQKPEAIYPFVTFMNVALAIAAASIGAALAALYPAFRASRLKPVDALRST
jgi:putative ABC transport system permease protein